MIKRYTFKYSKYKTSGILSLLICFTISFFITTLIFSFFVLIKAFDYTDFHTAKIVGTIFLFILVLILFCIFSFYVMIKKSNFDGVIELYQEYFILKRNNKIKRVEYASIKNIERRVFGEKQNQAILPVDISYTIKTNKENIKLYSSLLEGFKKTTFNERLKQKLPDYSIDNVIFQLENMMASYRISKI